MWPASLAFLLAKFCMVKIGDICTLDLVFRATPRVYQNVLPQNEVLGTTLIFSFPKTHQLISEC
jgi:hypothetical protein